MHVQACTEQDTPLREYTDPYKQWCAGEFGDAVLHVLDVTCRGGVSAGDAGSATPGPSSKVEEAYPPIDAVSNGCFSKRRTDRVCCKCGAVSTDPNLKPEATFRLVLPQHGPAATMHLRDVMWINFCPGTIVTGVPVCTVCGAQCAKMFTRLTEVGDSFHALLNRVGGVTIYGGEKPINIAERIDTAVDIPEVIDLAEFCVPALARSGRTRYRLTAVVNHAGEVRAGHYWTNVRTVSDGVWRKFNDRVVTEEPYRFGPSVDASLLFYTRI